MFDVDDDIRVERTFEPPLTRDATYDCTSKQATKGVLGLGMDSLNRGQRVDK